MIVANSGERLTKIYFDTLSRHVSNLMTFRQHHNLLVTACIRSQVRHIRNMFLMSTELFVWSVIMKSCAAESHQNDRVDVQIKLPHQRVTTLILASFFSSPSSQYPISHAYSNFILGPPTPNKANLSSLSSIIRLKTLAYRLSHLTTSPSLSCCLKMMLRKTGVSYSSISSLS